jgi:hypothetical protein
MDNIECAVLAYDIHNFICIDEFGVMSVDGDFMRKVEDDLIEQTNPEQLLIEKQRRWAEEWYYEELSEEAKQVFQLICDIPKDLKPVIGTGPGHNTISLKKLGRFLREHWEERPVVARVLQEIAEYTVKVGQY